MAARVHFVRSPMDRVLRIGVDRIGLPAAAAPPVGPSDRCPVDGARGVFQRTALVCPRCGRLLGGF
jgi:hypothetical protein